MYITKTMKIPTKTILVRFARFACFVCFAYSALAEMPSPRLPVPMSWSGTKDIASGSLSAALEAVDKDASSDTLLRLYKVGVINARMGNVAEALTALNAVNKGSAVLAPLAMAEIGDLAAAAHEETRAVAAYASALKASGLPVKYRNYLFAKIKRAALRGGELGPSQGWVDEYRKWERAQRLFDASGLEAICDSLAAAGQLAEADSLLEKHTPELSRREACGVVERIFKKRTADTALVTTKFLFSLASQSAECRNFATAERILTLAQKRADFSSAVPAKSAARLLGDIAFGREQWQKAVDYYKKYDTVHGPESDVLMNAARACRNMGQHDESQRWYDRHVERFPSHTKTQEILWLRAWNNEEAGRFKDAAAGYRKVFKVSGKRTEEAHIRHALCYYRLKQYDSTIVHLEAFKKKYPQSSYLWSGMFWQGKSHLAKGRAEEAYKIWGEIARLDPTDYHAHRARQLMGVEGDGAQKKGMFGGEQFAAQVSEKEARVWLDKCSLSSKKPLTARDSVDISRGAALLTVASAELADMFLYNFESNYSGNLQLQYDLANGYALSGHKANAFRVARRLAWRIPMEYRDKAPLQVLSVLFPPYYSATISRYAERFGVDPMFVSSVMRQESIFDYKIVSPAGAVGLMQVMPATGKGIAQELKEQFTEDSLYNPDYNVRFGTYYLKKRSAQFGGDKVLVLCSYNAGAHNATKWRDRNKGLEPDLFVEDIGFLETRGYVKKVMGNYWTYKALVVAPGYEYEEAEWERMEYRWIKVYSDF